MTRFLPVLALMLPLAARAGGFEADLAGIQEKTSIRFAQLRDMRAQAPKPAAKPAPALPAASDAEWAKIVEAVKTKGTYQPGVLIMPATFTLEDVEGDPKGDHVKRYVSFVGEVNEDGKFEAEFAALTWMDHKLDAATGNFNVEQWSFQTDIYGRVSDMGRLTGVMRPDGRPAARPTPEQVQPGDARAKTQFEALVKFWAEK